LFEHKSELNKNISCDGIFSIQRKGANIMILTVTLNPTVDKSYYIDKLLPGEVIRVNKISQTAGGKGINVAKIAKLLGNKVAATGFLGGNTGQYVHSFLLKAGIISEFIDVDEDTRTCVNVNDDERNDQTILLEPGSFIDAHKQEEFVDYYKKLLESCKAVVLGGSLPPGIENTYYPRLINIAKEAGKIVVLDTSGETLRAGINACPTMIKPNRDEISAYLGRNVKSIVETIAAAKEIHANGTDIVIVSLGKDGAVFAMNNKVYRGTTPDIKIVNTVGCGDSLVAGFVTGLINNYDILDTIKLGMAVSTANALSKEIGFFEKSDLEDLLTKVTAYEMK
jgi:tagatose 6-phosphate kinase